MYSWIPRPALLLFSATMLLAGGCRPTFKIAQTFLEPCQVYVKSTSPDAPVKLSAATGANSRFIAAAGDVDFAIEIYAPVTPGGGPTKIWEQEFRFSSGYMAWEIVISGSDSDKEEFIQLVPATWESARASLPHLPATVAGPNRAITRMAPFARRQLYRRDPR